MIGKYLIFAIAFLLASSSISIAFATNGSYLAPASANTSGPLVDSVVFTVYGDEASVSGAVVAGDVQAVEQAFSTAGYNALTQAQIIKGTQVQNSWFYMVFNYAMFPGNDIHFRRAIQFLQDYPTIQGTVLNTVEGQAVQDPLPCSIFVNECDPTQMALYYSFDVQKAGKELCLVSNLANVANCPAGPFSGASVWTCIAAMGVACPSPGAVFAPRLYYRNNPANQHHRADWTLDVTIPNAASIGLAIDGHPINSGSTCFNNLGPEVAPGGGGVYDSGTGYNSLPTFSGPGVAAGFCDMFTVGFISSTPAFNGDIETFSSQFAGSSLNAGNAYDDPAASTPADAVCGCPSFTHTLTNNIDYTINKVLYAPDAATADTWAQNFIHAYALQLPGVYGYFESTLYADNRNGWTNFVEAPLTGPNELGGLYWTLMNVHQCGTATCTLGTGAANGNISGTLNYALEAVSDQSGLNPLYATNWVWQADVFQSIYDSQLVTLPSDFTNINVFSDFMTNSHSVTNFASTITGQGAAWYYFQQPCGTNILTCQGKAFQHPGTKQHGIGLSAALRTITSGTKITFVLRPGLYFTDGVKVSASDLVFSYDFFNLANSPNYPDSASPADGLAGGSAGLIASHYLSNAACIAAGGAKGGPNGDCVELYLGSQSVWNLANMVSLIMPFHIWQYFNPDHVSTFSQGAVDSTRPYDFAATVYSISGAPHVPSSSWMHYLANIEVGAGPFYLASWSTTTGSGEIIRNPFYWNLNWHAMATMNPQAGPTYTITTSLMVPIYNPSVTTAIHCGPDTDTSPAPGIQSDVGPGSSWNSCELMGAGMPGVSWAAVGNGKVTVYDSGGNAVQAVKLLKDKPTGHYSMAVDLTTLPAGDYKVVLHTTYTFHGQHRVWYQIFAFNK